MEIDDDIIMYMDCIEVDLAVLNATYVVLRRQGMMVERVRVRDRAEGYDLVSQILKVQEELHEARNDRETNS